MNDESERGRWAEAADRMVQPVNVTRFPGGFSTASPAPTNAPVRLRGEILRAKINPSVTELLARHALEVPTNNLGAYDLSASCRMAEYLARWDPPAALPVAKILVKRACVVMRYSGPSLGAFVAKLSLARADAGDPQAFVDYVEWIVTTTPEQLGYLLADCLEPWLKFPANVVLQTAGLKLFADTNSPWARLPWKDNNNFNPIESELIHNRGLCGLLTRELENANVCGTCT